MPSSPLASALAALLLIACSGSSGAGGAGQCTNAPKISNAAGHLHGFACDQDSDCQYGLCDEGAVTTASAFGVCSKDCSCGVGSACNTDNDSAQGLSFTCIRPSGQSSRCVPICKSVADCTKIDSRYNDCSNTPPPPYTGGSIGVTKFCNVK